jgi:hypothetical protein
VITPSTLWRSLPPLSRARFVALLAGTPLSATSSAIYDALGDDLAMLAVLILWREQGRAGANTFAQSTHNPWLMRRFHPTLDTRPVRTHPRDGWFLDFPSYDAAAKELRWRLTDPEYKPGSPGVYLRTTTLLDLNTVYAPRGDGANDPVARTNAMVIDANNLLGETPMPDTPLVFGRVPKPAMFWARHVQKAWDGAGFTRVPPRAIVGSCEHRTEGNASIEWYWGFFGYQDTPNGRIYGQRHGDALVDYIVDKQGRIGEFNDPFGTRMPWANGATNGLEGDGPAFVRTLGVGAVNARLASIEIIGMPNDPFEGPQLEAVAHLMAWLHDHAKVPWDRFPLNPNVGCVTDLQHFEFTGKGGNSPNECPGQGVRRRTNDLQNRVRAIMKAAQTTVEEPTTPPPDPVENPAHAWPNGWTTAGLVARFGFLVHENEAVGSGDDRRTIAVFDPEGVISNAWVAKCVKERITEVAELPAPLQWWTLNTKDQEPIEFVIFERGWRLQSIGTRGGWEWV